MFNFESSLLLSWNISRIKGVFHFSFYLLNEFHQREKTEV